MSTLETMKAEVEIEKQFSHDHFQMVKYKITFFLKPIGK